MRVGYADQNGHPYRSIGRVLVDRGELPLERASMQGIREWGRRNPEKLGPLLDENPSYVFFREVPPPTPGTLEAQIDGPFGSLGVPLLRSAGRRGPRSVPPGVPVTSRPLTRFDAADAPRARPGIPERDPRGGARRLSWGFGDDAGRGRMDEAGRAEDRLWAKTQRRAFPAQECRRAGTRRRFLCAGAEGRIRCRTSSACRSAWCDSVTPDRSVAEAHRPLRARMPRIDRCNSVVIFGAPESGCRYSDLWLFRCRGAQARIRRGSRHRSAGAHHQSDRRIAGCRALNARRRSSECA